MANPLKAILRLDRWLLQRRLRWTTAFTLFAILAVFGTASMAIEGGHAVLVLAPAFLAFVHRYIRPNV
jgi:hypothetical protein